MVIAGVDSLHQGQQKVSTPHLNVRYEATPESTYWDV